MIDNTELNAYHERQSKQESDIATLRSRVDRIDKDGKYIYPPGSGFNYRQWLIDHPDSTEAGTYGSKVS